MRLTMAGVCLVLAAAPLAGQQPNPPKPGPGGGRAMRPMPGMPMRGMPMTDCPMMPMMLNGPAAALQAGPALGVSAEQRTRIQALQRQLDVASKPSLDSMQVLHAELMALVQHRKLDERAARVTFERMGRVHAGMGLAMLRAAYDVSAILTPAQRDSLTAMAQRQMAARGGVSMCGMPMYPKSGMGGTPKR
jgi:Spy/CpxP family protein refolding chaperone